MLITIKDFRKDFINKFSPEYQNYIINFCNTFQKTFPDILPQKQLFFHQFSHGISWMSCHARMKSESREPMSKAPSHEQK